MATALFSDIVFGPVHSRRLGVSLGVNLLPLSSKLCNFDCIYCECGWTPGGTGEKPRFHPADEVIRQLEERLSARADAGEPLDVITFAGNGEPTLHPEFPYIIGETLRLRDRYFPQVKVAVLSNATLIGRPAVREALLRVDRAILKVDSACEETIRAINKPRFDYSLRTVIDRMKAFRGEMIVQTMFLRGTVDGRRIDNTTEAEVSAWLEVVREIGPQMVMVYTIDRDTPAEGLEKVSVADMERIAERVRALGIACSVSGSAKN